MRQNETKVTGQNLEGKKVTFVQTNPPQMDLFQWADKSSERYSNFIRLYDAAPKYSSTKHMETVRENGKYLPTLKRTFRYKNTEYILEVLPARIERNGKEIECYPSQREELVEEALRKIAIDHLRGIFLNGKAGVQFTLQQLQKELKKHGHSIHYKNLIEALQICGRARIIIKTTDGKNCLESSIFPEIIIRSRRDWLRNPSETTCYAQFNSLVTESINQLDYRQHDYQKWMSYKGKLARYLHKRLWDKFSYADLFKSYDIRATTIIRDSGCVNHSLFRRCIAEIDEALGELKHHSVIRVYEKHPELQGRKLEDVFYKIYATLEFKDEMLSANRQERHLLEQAAVLGCLAR